MADGLFQHHAGALGQPGLGQPGADRAVDGSRRGEEGDDTFGLPGLVRQRGVILAAAELHAQVVQTGQETLQNAFLEFALGHMATQVLGDQRQMRSRLAAVAGEAENAGIRRQQAGTVELIERGKQLAQGQVTEGAEQRQGAGFDR